MSDEAWVLVIACAVMFVMVVAVLLFGGPNDGDPPVEDPWDDPYPPMVVDPDE